MTSSLGRFYGGVPDPTPRGYRNGFLAALGWLIVAASPEGDHAQGEKSYSHRTTADAPQIFSHPFIEASQPAPTSKHDLPCGGGKEDRNSELCAEWRSADQAQESSKWAARSFWAAAAGVAGLIATLWFNLEAWRAVRSGNKDTIRSLDIADRTANALKAQADIASKVATAQTRPYIVHIDAVPDVFNNSVVDGEPARIGLAVRINFKNVGSMPASNVRIHRDGRVTSPDVRPDFVEPLNYENENGVVGPTVVFSCSHFAIGEADYNFIINREKVLWVYAKCQYTSMSVPNQEFETEACFMLEYAGNVFDAVTQISRPFFLRSVRGPQNKMT